MKSEYAEIIKHVRLEVELDCIWEIKTHPQVRYSSVCETKGLGPMRAVSFKIWCRDSDSYKTNCE